MRNKKFTRNSLSSYKADRENSPLQMLTCYDYPTACILNETDIDIILVGDSLGNTVLGYKNTINVTLEEMIIFSSAVKRGATDKFVVVDLPFGSYVTIEKGLESSIKLIQSSGAEAVKLEGAYSTTLQLISRLTESGIPVMGHIGLTPQSINQLGGYYIHGKDSPSAQKLLKEAISLERAGAFSIVLECVTSALAKQITNNLKIPTIGIGSGKNLDGQVLVINDLLGMNKELPPSFCKPVANLYQKKKKYIQKYLKQNKKDFIENLENEYNYH